MDSPKLGKKIDPRITSALRSIQADLRARHTRLITGTDFRKRFDSLKTSGELTGVSFARFERIALEHEGVRREALQRVHGYHSTTSTVRYTFGIATEYELAVSLRPGSYLCHGSAIFLHGLNDENPRVVYLNWEQTPKPRGKSGLSQDRLNYAFRRPQRTSKLIYKHGEIQIAIVNGKHTGGTGVENLELAPGIRVPVTNIERTLVDIVVRPAYAGGPASVLEAYRRSTSVASPATMYVLLQHLDYIYPYHQAIGFLLERAGFPAAETERFKTLGMNFDFYLTHGMREPEYDPSWRLFFPKGL